MFLIYWKKEKETKNLGGYQLEMESTTVPEASEPYGRSHMLECSFGTLVLNNDKSKKNTMQLAGAWNGG